MNWALLPAPYPMRVAPEPIYTLADLIDWPLCLGEWPSGGTALAVVGRPVAHSLSPVLHNAALAELARTRRAFGNWRYFKFDVAPDELPRALALFHEKKFRGLNLTVPHKSLAVDHLVSRTAFVHAAGAANTLIFTEAGWRGANTDGDGLTIALREELGVELSQSQVVLLGAGGAARAAAVECLRRRCISLWIGNRTKATLDALLASLQAFAPDLRIQGFDLAAPPAELPAGSVVINATSLGLGLSDPAPVELKRIPSPVRVYDMIYRPPQTALLREASALGIKNANGLSMLIHQGALSLGMWTGEPTPVAVMQTAGRAALNAA